MSCSMEAIHTTNQTKPNMPVVTFGANAAKDENSRRTQETRERKGKRGNKKANRGIE